MHLGSLELITEFNNIGLDIKVCVKEQKTAKWLKKNFVTLTTSIFTLLTFVYI